VAEGAELGLLDQVWGAARGGKYREAAGLLLFLFLGMVGRYWTVIPWKKIWDPLSDRQRTWAVMAMAMAASAAVTLPGNVPLETVLENGLVAGAVAVAAWHSGGKDVFAKLAAWKAARKAAKASSAEPPGPAASSSR
jgi:hypothetical protein